MQQQQQQQQQQQSEQVLCFSRQQAIADSISCLPVCVLCAGWLRVCVTADGLMSFLGLKALRSFFHSKDHQT